MSTLHIGIDEAGDFGFQPSGSKYLVFTAVITYDPAPLATSLTSLRFSLMKQGHDLSSFHCCEDLQGHRDLVTATMMANTDWSFASIVVEKRKVNPVLHAPDTFYPKFVTPLLRFILRGSVRPGTDTVVICSDEFSTRKKREAILKTLKQTCAAELPNRTLQIFNHCRHSNKWVQVADYCCWGVQRKWERSDTRTYDTLRPRMVKTELDLCSHGDQTVYY